MVCGWGELNFSGLIPQFELVILTKGREAGEVAGTVGKNKWDYRNGRGTGTYWRDGEQHPTPSSSSLPLPESAFVIVGCGILFTHNCLLITAGHGERKDQVGITFVLKRMMMIKRRTTTVMTTIFRQCFHHILLRIFLVFWDSLAWNKNKHKCNVFFLYVD